MAVLRKKITTRIRVLRTIVVGIVVAYAANLFSLQILRREVFVSEAERISMQSIRIRAPRGEIYDRTGQTLLAGNRDAYSVQITPSEIPQAQRDDVLGKLSNLLGIPKEDLARKMPAGTAGGYGKITLASNTTFQVIATIASRVEEFPGVSWTVRPLRVYGDVGSLAGVLGYVGTITRDEYKLLYNKGYASDDITGKTGVELTYEEYLKGRDGWIAKAVDVKGRDIKSIEQKMTPAEPGKKLVLSIDLAIQKAAEVALGKRTGSVVVLKPSTGEILAMVSYPWYDPNLFLSDNAGTEYMKLLQDPQNPLLNRAYQSSYPPASTFKTVITATLLEEKPISPDRTVYCAGELDYGGRTWSCHIKRPGHGPVNLPEALAQSCDIYYWTVGRDFLGIENIVSYTRDFGYGKATGIDLPSENAGLVPTPSWKERTFNEPWTPGDTMNLSIGQGYMLATPLQVANMMAMIVNDGVLYKPHVVKEIRDPQTGSLVREITPEVLHKSSISRTTFATLRSYLRGVIVHGTARVPVNTKAVQVAGKTGTAEVGLKNRWHSWFASFGPYDAKPEDQIVVVTMIEASNPWEWWAPYSANVIYQSIFSGQDPKTAAATVGVKLEGSGLAGRRE
ncbi:MAG: penicillin-binding protein 2 [Spirochaetales bacterium]|nr:penicillin-binding protein 2 [Spirochaetales bacterium]